MSDGLVGDAVVSSNLAIGFAGSEAGTDCQNVLFSEFGIGVSLAGIAFVATALDGVPSVIGQIAQVKMVGADAGGCIAPMQYPFAWRDRPVGEQPTPAVSGHAAAGVVRFEQPVAKQGFGTGSPKPASVGLGNLLPESLFDRYLRPAFDAGVMPTTEQATVTATNRPVNQQRFATAARADAERSRYGSHRI